jgi:NADH dehydrogenase/NADH:ubiquinone oxidoreductase subunit G
LSSNIQIQQNIQKELKRANRSRIKWRMSEIQFRLVKGEKDKDIMRTLLLSERNYYKYKKKISVHLEEIQKERTDSAIWLEVQTLKDRMSHIYSVLAERIKDPYTKTSDLSQLASTAESIAINILKLESSSISAAIKQSNIILENHIKRQLPSSRSKYQQELPKIIYEQGEETYGLEQNNTIDTQKNKITFND